MLEKQKCVHDHMYKTKRGAPVREEVESYTITIGNPLPWDAKQTRQRDFNCLAQLQLPPMWTTCLKTAVRKCRTEFMNHT